MVDSFKKPFKVVAKGVEHFGDGKADKVKTIVSYYNTRDEAEKQLNYLQNQADWIVSAAIVEEKE